MSFDIFIIASSNTPPAVEFRAAARETVAAAGGKLSSDGVMVELPSGAVFELFMDGDDADSMAALRQLTPDTCTVLFRLAEATSTFIMTDSKDGGPFRTPSNRGAPPDGLPPQTPIATADALCAALSPNFGTWSAYRDQVTKP